VQFTPFRSHKTKNPAKVTGTSSYRDQGYVLIKYLRDER